MSRHVVKGTVSRDVSSQDFVIKQLLLVSISMPRNDFEFKKKIFLELFVFVIESLVKKHQGVDWNPSGKAILSNIHHMSHGSLSNLYSVTCQLQ